MINSNVRDDFLASGQKEHPIKNGDTIRLQIIRTYTLSTQGAYPKSYQYHCL
ncbi:hypothetical protein HHE06_03770 [Helicobacter heilmannii]|nr:hypothetical protein BN341_17210 [Helicobacter heilmannii ASB1.4]CRF50156.1 hypothetical protein HHE03_18650 [Helicobacter heilmannii]CRF50541.1 hypothetical protein HHE06_03770 [Helicobacter heilmannii]